MPDLLQVSLGTTRGLRSSDAWFADFTRRAGVSIETIGVRVGATAALRRAYPVTDLVEAVAARRATASGLARMRPRAVVFSTTTAALLAPDPNCPFAVRLDAPARLNRPGVHNAPVHALERRSLSRARLVLPCSVAAETALPPGSARSVVVPPPVRVSAEAHHPRECLAVAYTPDPKAKGLDLLCKAWVRAAIPDARLEVFGIEPAVARRHLRRTGAPEPANVSWRGWTPPEQFHAAVARSQAFISSARWEDFGMAQLEALALGALLVCTATQGPFEAGSIARELRAELVAPDLNPESLAVCVTHAFALDEASEKAYRGDALTRLVPYRAETIARTIAERVLPTLLGG